MARVYSSVMGGKASKIDKKELNMEKGGSTDFNPDGKIKDKIVHASGDAGGMLVGKRHSNGGIKALNKSTGQPLEMEGGEVVITRNAVSDNKKRSFNGKMLTNRQILSEINESGGGVSFADGGKVPNDVKFDCNAEYEYGGKTMCGKDLAYALGGVTTAIVTDPNEAMADLQSTYGFGDVYAKGGIVWKKNIGDEGWSSTMESNNAYENEGGYISEDGNWKIYRLGDFYKRDWGDNYERRGLWTVEYKNKSIGYRGSSEPMYLSTLKDAKEFVSQINNEKFAKGGEVNEAYVDFMNKDKGFKVERKYFKTYQDAEKWARSEFERFNPDMISYTEYETPLRSYDEGGTIECGSCDWSWDEKDGGDDVYVCHKCGTDNTNEYKNGGITINNNNMKKNNLIKPKRKGKNIMTLAKEIRKKDESWQDALKRAKIEMNKTSSKKSSNIDSELGKLKELIKEDEILKEYNYSKKNTKKSNTRLQKGGDVMSLGIANADAVYNKGGKITGAGKSGLDKIKKISKDNPSQMYKVTDDNYSNIGNFYLKNGKFAKNTVSNADYDFAKNKVSLRPKSDVIYKATEIEGKGGYFKKGGKLSKDDAITKALKLGVDFNKDFHSQSFGNELSELAKETGYRKSKSSSGSLGRSFFNHLQKIYDKNSSYYDSTLNSRGYAKGGDVQDVTIKQMVYSQNGNTYTLDEYQKLPNEKLMDRKPLAISVAKAKLFEYNDEAFDYEDEIMDIKDVDELADFVRENNLGTAYNTYNDSWWGGVRLYVLVHNDGDKVDYDNDTLIFMSYHRGGDVRGNYEKYEAFDMQGYLYEEFPIFADRMTVIVKKDGKSIIADSEDMEGYDLYINESDFDKFEEGDNTNLDDLGDELGFEAYKYYEKGGKTQGDKFQVEIHWKGLSKDKTIGKYIITEKTLDELEEQWLHIVSIDVLNNSNKKPISWFELKKELFSKGRDKGLFAKGGRVAYDKMNNSDSNEYRLIERAVRCRDVLLRTKDNKILVIDERNDKIYEYDNSYNNKQKIEDFIDKLKSSFEKGRKYADGGRVANYKNSVKLYYNDGRKDSTSGVSTKYDKFLLVSENRLDEIKSTENYSDGFWQYPNKDIPPVPVLVLQKNERSNDLYAVPLKNYEAKDIMEFGGNYVGEYFLGAIGLFDRRNLSGRDADDISSYNQGTPRYAKGGKTDYKGRKYADGGTIGEYPRVYIADLEAYNNGELKGEWLDLADYNDSEEFNDAVQDLLDGWGVEEYAIHDVENFPDGMYSEYMGTSDFDEIYDMIELAKNNDLPLDVVMEVVSQYDESAVEEYQGQYEDGEDFASQMIDDIGLESFNDPQYFVDIYPTDRRILAQEMADSYIENIEDEDDGERVVEEAGLDVDEYRELDGEDDDKRDEILEEAKEIVRDEYYETWYDGLDDPYDFLVNEQGLYSDEDFFKANFIQIDYGELANALEQDYLFIENDKGLFVFNVR